MNYRVKVIKVEATANGQVQFDCMIQREETEDSWGNVVNGHRTLQLSAAAIRSITEHPTKTPNEKRSELRVLFQAQARSWGIDEADMAYDGIMELIPDWPVNVALDV